MFFTICWILIVSFCLLKAGDIARDDKRARASNFPQTEAERHANYIREKKRSERFAYVILYGFTGLMMGLPFWWFGAAHPWLIGFASLGASYALARAVAAAILRLRKRAATRSQLSADPLAH
jgi:hypothetical protein